MFKKAVKEQIKIRLALSGPSGSGKTFSALKIGKHLGKSIAVIDTEHESSLRYADLFNFDVCGLDDPHPARYIDAINYAESAGYEVIITDSLSHAWFKELELAGNNFNNWAKVRPLERKLIETIIGSKAHIIATMRSKTEYVEQVKNGKKVYEKQGTEAVQVKGIEYEFDIAGELSLEHILTISKSRCPQLTDKTFLNPGKELADILLKWANAGEVKQQQPLQFTRTQQTKEESYPQPPEPKIWQSWKSLDDAINWALTVLSDADTEFLKSLWNPQSKTRGDDFLDKVYLFAETGEYKKSNPEPEPELVGVGSSSDDDF